MQDQTLPTLTQSALRGLACRCPRCGKGRAVCGNSSTCDRTVMPAGWIMPSSTPRRPCDLHHHDCRRHCRRLRVDRGGEYQPPFWLHAVLWLPLILATTVLPLRAMKSLLIALQFHHKAAPGRLIDREPK